jgi:hypothetical protein
VREDNATVISREMHDAAIQDRPRPNRRPMHSFIPCNPQGIVEHAIDALMR